METLGVSMIVKDEHIERIAGLVGLLSPVAIQFAILDTGSESFLDDQRKAGTWKVDVHYGQTEWRPDFSAMRNATLEHLTTDWVLAVDADEMPNFEMIKSLHRILAECDPKTLGWLYFTINYWGGERGISVEEHWHCRLFRRTAGKWYKPVHEQVMLNGAQEPTTRGTTVLPKADPSAYIIHMKPQQRIDTSAIIYSKIEGHS